MRETFIIKSSWESVFDDLSDKQAGVLIKAIFSYVATGEKPNLMTDLEVKMAFKFISADLDAFEKRYQKKCDVNKENGMKGAEYGKLGGRPRKSKENPENPERGYENPEKPPKDNDNDFSTTTIPDGIDSSVVAIEYITTTETKNQNPRTREGKPRKTPSPVEPTVVDLKTCSVSGNEWRTNYQSYLSALRQCYKALTKDEAWLAERKRLNPRVDVLLTLEKACIEFWAAEAGWKHKKKEKSNTIDWKATFTNSISAKFNKVYENGTGNNQGKRGNALDGDYLADLARRTGVGY